MEFVINRPDYVNALLIFTEIHVKTRNVRIIVQPMEYVKMVNAYAILDTQEMIALRRPV